MKKLILIIAFISFLSILAFIIYFPNAKQSKLLSPLGQEKKEKPLEKYAFDNLRRLDYHGSQIELEKVLNKESKFTSYLFTFLSDRKKVSGVANIPSKKGKLPVIVMIRGFVEKEKYTPGSGTKNSSKAFARNGFITLAPDFLGYGESASPSADVFEERLEKYTAVLNLLASIKSIPKADPKKIGIWGHSNGGQIALSILEITGYPYPTVLWAPVSKPFPYSILYYTDEYDDRGRLLRKALARFEIDYDVDKYDPTLYYDWIDRKAPIQLHQGGRDDAVPKNWSDALYDTLTELDLDIEYFTYPDEDHNFAQGSWQTIINRNILFYKNNLL
jgi:dipeptidyl aminopeptidase/acylaminoacyl peptidase